MRDPVIPSRFPALRTMVEQEFTDTQSIDIDWLEYSPLIRDKEFLIKTINTFHGRRWIDLIYSDIADEYDSDTSMAYYFILPFCGIDLLPAVLCQSLDDLPEMNRCAYLIENSLFTEISYRNDQDKYLLIDKLDRNKLAICCSLLYFTCTYTYQPPSEEHERYIRRKIAETSQ